MGEKRKSNARDRAVRGLAVVGGSAVLLYGAKVLINLFGPQPKFTIGEDLGVPLDSEQFIRFLSLITDGTRRRSRLKRLKNGAEFFPEILRAIRRAKYSINMEFYEFLRGRVGAEMVEALAERARAGVEVRVLVDFVGSAMTGDGYLAGCGRLEGRCAGIIHCAGIRGRT